MDKDTIVSIYEFLRTAFTVVDVFLFAFLVFLVVKSWRFRPKFKFAPKGQRVYTLGNVVLQERWESIIARGNINSQESMRLAIIDADNMIDELLKRMGLEGEHMADKLENLSTEDFKTLNRLWAAHRLRNRIVHEPGFVASHEDTLKAIEDYGSFLKEIGAINGS